MNTSHNKPDLLRIALCLMFILVPLVYVHDLFFYVRFAFFVCIALAALGLWLTWPSNLATGFLLGLLILAPLAYAHDIFLYTRLPKRFVLFICIALATLGWWLRTRTLTWPSNPAKDFLLGLLGLASLSFWQTTHALDSLVEFSYQISLVSLFFIASSALTTRDLPALLKANAIAGLIIGTIGILQYHNLAFVHIPSTGHPSATFAYRNFAAMYVICALPLSIFFFLYAKSRTNTILALLSTVCLAVFLIYTRTRGAWGGLGIGLIAITVFFLNRNLRQIWWQAIAPTCNKQKTILSLCGIALIAILAPFAPRFTDTGLQRFDEKKTDITSTVTSAFQSDGDRGRTDMWRNTLNLIRDYPLLGVGPGSWKRTYPPYDRGVMIRQNTSPVRPHNDYLWICAEYGLAGLFCYLGFLACILYALYNARYDTDPIRVASAPIFAVALIAIHGHAFFSFPKEQPQAAMFIYLLGGFAVGHGKRVLCRSASQLVFVILIVQALGAAALYCSYIRFDKHYLRALIAEDHNDWPGVEREILSALNWGSFRSHAWVIAGRAAERQENFAKAESAYRQAIALSPHSWHAHNGMGIVLKRRERYEEAKLHYLEALRYFPGEHNPNGVDIRTNLGALYKRMGDFTRAEQMYRQVLTAHPTNAGANNNMANFYKARGQLDSALVAYQTALTTDSTQVQAHFNLSDLYIKKRQYKDALRHAELAVQLQTTDPRLFWNLGLVLESNQRLGDAEKAYLQALVQDPQFAQAYFNLGNLLFDRESYARAKLAFQAFLELWTGESHFKDFAQDRLNQCNSKLAAQK